MELESKPGTDSMYNARVTMQIKTAPHTFFVAQFFLVLNPSVTRNGPKRSIPIYVKGGDSERRSLGKLAIMGTCDSPLILRQVTQAFITLLIKVLQPSI